MKKIFYHITLTLFLISSTLSIAPLLTKADSSFTDITPGSEMHDAVLQLAERQVINGFADGTFKPASPVTRAQAAKILAGALGLDLENSRTLSFKDINSAHYAYPAVAALVDYGVLNGDASHFRPNDQITRAEMAKMLVTAFQLEERYAYLDFQDIRGHWAESYIRTLYSFNVTKGISDTLFGVNTEVTRAQMATFIIRAENNAPAFYLSADSHTFTVEPHENLYVFRLEPIVRNPLFDIIQEETRQTVTVKALKPGVSYIRVSVAHKDLIETTEDNYYEHYYKVTIHEENRHLKMQLEKVENFIPEETLYTYKAIKSYEVEALNEQEIPEGSFVYATSGEDEYQVYTAFQIQNLSGDFLIHAKYPDGTPETFGMHIENEDIFSENITGYYTEGKRDILLATYSAFIPTDLAGFKIHSLKEYGYEKGYYDATDVTDDELQVNVLPDRLQVTPNKPGSYELIISNNAVRAKFFINVEYFYNGHIISLTY